MSPPKRFAVLTRRGAGLAAAERVAIAQRTELILPAFLLADVWAIDRIDRVVATGGRGCSRRRVVDLIVDPLVQ